MSNQNDKEKDKNVRISENDIQKKLYGNFSKPKNKEKPVIGKFSEDIIKNKLYGNGQSNQKETAKKSEPISAGNDLFSTKKADTVKTEQAKHDQPKAQTAYPQKEKIIQKPITPKPQEVQIMPAYQDEIDALKQAIANLENKLQKTEVQKHKLKVRLVQKRKLINIRERLADLVLYKMPEKFILLLVLIIVTFLVVTVLNLNNQNPDEKQAMPTEEAVQTRDSKPVSPAIVERTAQRSNIEQPKVQSIEAVRRYTIQVAEYADEKAAMNFISDLKAKGFDVYLKTIYRGPNNTRPYFKINVGSFDTFNEAKAYNLKFRKKTKINDSFIRERKQ